VPRVEFSFEAERDLEGIDEYTAARWGEAQVRKYLDTLERRLGELASRPLMGRPRGDLAEGLRSSLFESHVIFYMPTDFGIFVVRVLHQRQDARRHFG
jgi:toxin ParE1/3/4